MKKQTALAIFFASSIFLAACAPKATPDFNEQIQNIVAATMLALPTAAPPPTPYPSPTPFNLSGFFCEYKFCIGHPDDVSFFDLSAQKNPAAPSGYDQGVIAAVKGDLYIQLIWQLAPGAADPQFLLDLVTNNGADTRVGAPNIKLERGMNVAYVPITSTATILPFGGAGAWTCGNRVFAWKAYAMQSESATVLFEEALARFDCGQ